MVPDLQSLKQQNLKMPVPKLKGPDLLGTEPQHPILWDPEALNPDLQDPDALAPVFQVPERQDLDIYPLFLMLLLCYIVTNYFLCFRTNRFDCGHWQY